MRSGKYLTISRLKIDRLYISIFLEKIFNIVHGRIIWQIAYEYLMLWIVVIRHSIKKMVRESDVLKMSESLKILDIN